MGRHACRPPRWRPWRRIQLGAMWCCRACATWYRFDHPHGATLADWFRAEADLPAWLAHLAQKGLVPEPIPVRDHRL